ncbi:DUF2637 domain-containing protein [Kitasatospora sp. NPDC127060]|uniref:DUF2637 domain-containing protein n=1 Tax=Kitasatospora sp. NPDC127060 TaxID=3347121 RepID=UPI0036507241
MGESVARPVLKTIHWWMIGFVALGAFLIAAIGLGGSYLAVRDVALRQHMGDFSYVFPIGVDAGIIVLLTLDLVLTWLRIPFPLLRPTAWTLTVATVAFNAAASWPDPLGVGMHAVIPVLFVIISEAGRHAIARLARLSSDRSIDKIRLMRWLLAPVQTWRLWRRMQLWEIRSLDDAIRGEQALQTYNTLVATKKRSWWRRFRDRGLPPAAALPKKLAGLGVPLEVTYEAGLAAAGVDAEPLTRLLDHHAQTARAAAPALGQAEPRVAHAQAGPGEIALRKELAQQPAETIAQDHFVQESPAHAVEPVIAQPFAAQSEQAFMQFNGHETAIAHVAPELAEAPAGVAQAAGETTGGAVEADLLRTGDAHQSPAVPAAQNGIAQPGEEAVHQQWQPVNARPVPTARVSALGTATGPVITQQTDDSQKIPSGWAEGFQAFVAEFGRHPRFGPKETELADYLHTRGYRSNKPGDGPVSQDSVRRYYNQLCERFPAPDAAQQSLDLQGSLV